MEGTTPAATLCLQAANSTQDGNDPLGLASDILLRRIPKGRNRSADPPVVAFPTETVYGLGANALDEDAVMSIFKAKGRPSDNPLIVHVSSIAMIESTLLSPEYNTIPSIYLPLIEKYWPGPLTILLPRGPHVSSTVTAGHDTVAVRMPNHPVALALIEKCNVPIAAPSANTSTRPSPTQASHVLKDLDGKIPLIIDGGDCPGGVESTVLNGLVSPPVILRPGNITLEMIRLIPGFEDVKVHRPNCLAASEVPLTPGMKYKHYTPNVEVILLEVQDSIVDRNARMKDGVVEQVQEYQRRVNSELETTNITKNKTVGVLRTTRLDLPDCIKHNVVEEFLGDSGDPAAVATTLFRGLRSLESAHVGLIIIEGISEDREGLGVMNRARKAAGKIIILD